MALKITNRGGAAEYERDLSIHISQANVAHPGLHHIRTVVDHFEITSTASTHNCLVFEPMREPLWLLQTRIYGQRFPVSVVKGFVKLLLKGLVYLHTECHVVHAGKVRGI